MSVVSGDHSNVCLTGNILQVTDSKGHHLYVKEEAESGKFIFNTEDYDVYEVCFISRVPPSKLNTRLV